MEKNFEVENLIERFNKIEGCYAHWDDGRVYTRVYLPRGFMEKKYYDDIFSFEALVGTKETYEDFPQGDL